MPYPGRNKIYEAIIRRMVREALDEREREFARAHGSDSEEELLDYLRACAQSLGHSPWPGEVDGGHFIEERFGSWETALEKAGLPKATAPDRPCSFARYKAEEERQKALYRERKAEKKKF